MTYLVAFNVIGWVMMTAMVSGIGYMAYTMVRDAIASKKEAKAIAIRKAIREQAAAVAVEDVVLVSEDVVVDVVVEEVEVVDVVKQELVASLVRIQAEMDAIADSVDYTYDAWRTKQLEYINVCADLASYNWAIARKTL